MKKIMFVPILLALTACSGTKSAINDDKVFFAFDSAEINNVTKKDLVTQSAYIKKHDDVNVILEGHCDERGATEYNLALGALRAGNAAHVMIKEGIEPARIKTISYGKEYHQYLGTSEEVWSKNRNVTTKTKMKQKSPKRAIFVVNFLAQMTLFLLTSKVWKKRQSSLLQMLQRHTITQLKCCPMYLLI